MNTVVVAVVGFDGQIVTSLHSLRLYSLFFFGALRTHQQEEEEEHLHLPEPLGSPCSHVLCLFALSSF